MKNPELRLTLQGNLSLDTKDLSLYRKRFEDFETLFTAAKQQLSPERFKAFIEQADEQYAVLTTRSNGYIRGVGNFIWVGYSSKGDIQYTTQIQAIVDGLQIVDFMDQEFFN